jgi:DNA-binding winged helix-turn-helix (wHTH) protein
VSAHSEGNREQSIAFGPYLLFPSQRILRQNNRVVHIGNRAMGILIALVERAGEVVSHKELINHAWPNSIVEANNLRVHVAAIRKVLGDGQAGDRYIRNVIGRGYSFVAPIERVAPPSPNAKVSSKTHRLPLPATRIIGRDLVIGTLV